mmetsp:Transcript_20113/g.28305  ORF Transcript_20113/g.28305 Transcript_20113/m.28305 type:complete len:316 (-) Transcript_20113:13-960(-)
MGNPNDDHRDREPEDDKINNDGNSGNNGKTSIDNAKKNNATSNKNKAKVVFKGLSSGMQGHVFQMHSEHHKKGQFEETMKALGVYASVTYAKDSVHMQALFENLEEPKVEQPSPPQGNKVTLIKDTNNKEVEHYELDEVQKLIFMERIKKFVSQEESLKAAMSGLYKIVRGQCSKMLLHQLVAWEEFTKVEQSADVVKLLKQIKVIMNEVEGSLPPHDAADTAKRSFYAYEQGDADVTTHVNNVKTLFDMVLHHKGEVADETTIKAMEKAHPNLNKEQALEKARRKIVGLTVLKSCRYKKVYEKVTHIQYGSKDS